MGEFIVQKGQTLSQIAKMHNTTVEAIAKQNGIKDVNKIQIGQKLIIGANPKETKTKELGDIDKRIAANQKEIEKLKSRTLTDQAKQEINAEINAMKSKLKGLAKEAKAEAMKQINAAEQKLIAAYRKGESAFNAAKQEVKKDFFIALGAIKAAYDGAVDGAESVAKGVANTGKKAARAARNAAKVNVKPQVKERTPDFSKMSKDQILAYQQKEINKLKKQSLTDRAKQEIKANIDAAERYVKNKWNSAVDGAYDLARDAYHGVRKAAKGFFNWLR